MSFTLSVETLRQIGTLYNVSKFVFATKSVIEEIGGNEFKAAIHSLDDMCKSSNPERELNMAITQLRSALEHFSSKSDGFWGSISAMKQKFQTALLISLCYRILSEDILCIQYKDNAIKYFSEWIESKSYCPSGKLHWKKEYYDRVKEEVNNLGLCWSYTYPKDGFFDFLSDSYHRKFNKCYSEHKMLIKEQFQMIANRI